MPRYYSINLVLKNKKCVVIGAGNVAERKARRLVECAARVSVISPAITPGLKAMAQNGRIILKNRNFNLSDLNGAYLVIAATTDRSVNAAVSSYCRRKNILVNVADSPEECSFILPSIIRRGDLTISISTGGSSPALSKKIRKDLEKMFGAEYAALLRIMKKIRPQARKKIKDPRSRKAFFKKTLQPETMNLLKQNKGRQVMRKLKDILDNA
ncbi:MAG: hypothetical protein A3G36_01430 [Omnitrophica bacterium RIFCSPLOWO2_12_FULL_45_13]|nr:MAG: hypothetical protein A3G36_01430 [Omnitrophica bacterium RIFCSPLOWO2_12_FULL_45_13]